MESKSLDVSSIADKPVIIHKSLQWLLNLPNNTFMDQDETRCASLDKEGLWVSSISNYSHTALLLDFLRENKVIYETT